MQSGQGGQSYASGETSLLVGRVSSRLVASLCVAFLDLPFAKFRFLAASHIFSLYIAVSRGSCIVLRNRAAIAASFVLTHSPTTGQHSNQ